MAYDFTDVEGVWFEYIIKDESGERQTVRLDADRTLIEWQERQGSLFASTGKKKKDGTMQIRAELVEYYFNHPDETWPEDVPRFSEVIRVARSILHVPDYLTDLTVIKVMEAFMVEMQKREALKKNTPDLPVLPPPTRARSKSKRSRKKRV